MENYGEVKMHLETVSALKTTGMSLKYYSDKNSKEVKNLVSLHQGKILFLHTCTANATFCDALQFIHEYL